MLSLKALTPVRLIRNQFYHEVTAMEAEGASPEELREHLGRGRSRRGMFEGDLDAGELEIGQVAGAIREVKPAAAIVAEIIEEYTRLKTTIGEGGRF